MLKSMTGYGFSKLDTEMLNVSVEIKTLNSKNIDTSIRLGSSFSKREIEVKNLLGDALERGKITLFVKYTPKGETPTQMSVNLPMVKEQVAALKQVSQQLDIEQQDILRIVMSLPDAYLSQTDDDSLGAHWKLIRKTIEEAVSLCDDFRKREGAKLKEKFEIYIQEIADLLDKVIERDPVRLENIRKKLQSHMKDFVESSKFDENRFEQELIYYAEKLDITEEKVRLRTHLNYFTKVLNKENSNGKELNFLSQEIGREINTIGSKANDAILQHLVVDMKKELEKIKEQALNVL